MSQRFNYDLEVVNETLCIDMKSFYASVECVERQLDPLTTMLVVMSRPETGGGLALATSPKAKELLGITNVSRKHDIPPHPDLYIVPPRMSLYIEKNLKIYQLLQHYVAEEDILVYSIDEFFVRVTASKRLFNMTTYEFARRFQDLIFKETGLYCTIGIGDNMLLSKLALDNEAKTNQDMIAVWQYQDLPKKIWQIQEMTDFWGINHRTQQRLNHLGIQSLEELANYDFFRMKENMGVIGQQLIAHAWGIDRTDMSEVYQPKSKSIGNSQVLTKDYWKRSELEIVLREMSEQVATRLRKKDYQTGCVKVSIGYSKNQLEKGFSRQITVPPTNDSKCLVDYVLDLFRQYDTGGAVRTMSVSYSKLTVSDSLQLNLFEEPEALISRKELDDTIDKIRQRYGFDALIHASSQLEGATAVSRSRLIGGHAGGMEGL